MGNDSGKREHPKLSLAPGLALFGLFVSGRIRSRCSRTSVPSPRAAGSAGFAPVAFVSFRKREHRIFHEDPLVGLSVQAPCPSLGKEWGSPEADVKTWASLGAGSLEKARRPSSGGVCPALGPLPGSCLHPGFSEHPAPSILQIPFCVAQPEMQVCCLQPKSPK